MSAENSDQPKHFIPTGVPGLDRVLKGGFYRPQSGHYPAVLVSGPAGAGKSTLATSIMLSTLQRSPDASVVYVLTEEQPSDAIEYARSFKSGESSEGKFPAVLDTAYDVSAESAFSDPNVARDLQSQAIIYTYYPDTALRATDALAPSALTLSAHLKDRIEALNTPCSLIIIDSLWIRPTDLLALDGSSAREYDALSRAEFKALCSFATVVEAPIVLLAESASESDLDWREFVSDIVIRLERSAGAPESPKRTLTVLKSRYQPSLHGEHALSLTNHGAVVTPNGRTYTAERRRMRERDELHPGDSTGLKNLEPFADGPAFRQFFSRGLESGSAILLYGDDQTRKRLTAVRCLEQGVKLHPNKRCLVVCLGPARKTFDRVLREYARKEPTDSSPGSNRDADEAKAPLLRSVDIIEAHADGGPAYAIGQIAELIEDTKEKYSRVVVDDLAALRGAGWYEFVALAQRLFDSYGLMSLFVHTLEKEEQHNHRVMFDTIVRAKRFYRYLKTNIPYFAYTKTKENSISPTNTSWWRVEVQADDQEVKMYEMRDMYLVGGNLIQKEGSLPT